jgi:outer membrane cobalamin receptor
MLSPASAGSSPIVRSGFRLLLTLVLLGYAAPLLAATLRGTVVDPQGRPVPAIRVVIVGPIATRAVYSNPEGRFEVSALAPATYRVFAEAAGWGSPAGVVTLAEQDAAEIRVALTVAGLSESVVVSASNVPAALTDTPASVAVVTAADLRARQVSELGEALQTVPGLTVSRNGGRGALTSLFPRGGESDYTLVLVDGMRLNSFGGGIDLSQLAIGNVERIEVVTGPQSAVYGADAIGGVIQVITKHDGPIEGEVLAEGGSQSTWRALGSTAGSRSQWSWSGSAERRASDGFTGVAPASGEQVDNDDWRDHQLAGSLGWAPTSDASVRLVARSHEATRGAPGPYGSNPIGVFPGVDHISRGHNDDRQVGVTAAHGWGRLLSGRVQQRSTVSHSTLDGDFKSAFGNSTFETRRVSLRTQVDFGISADRSATVGIEGLIERARSTYIVDTAASETPIRRRVVGYFGEFRQQVGPALSITAGVRLDDIVRRALPGDPNGFSPRPDFDKDVEHSVNPRVAAVWSPWRSANGERTRLHASFGTGIRPPDAFEIAFTDNPQLKPERNRSYEVGVAQSLARTPLDLQATLFRNDYDDLIVAVGRSLQDASRFRTDNVSNARAQGLELTGSWRQGWGLTLRGTYTWLDTEILAVDRTGAAPPPFSPGDPLIRRPRHQANVEVLYSASRVNAFVNVGGRGHWLDVEPNYGAFGGLFRAPGFVVADAGVTVRLTRFAYGFVRVTNLFDRTYEETLGYPALGRSGMAGLRVAVGR